MTIPILDDDLLEINEIFRVEIMAIGNDSMNCTLVQPNVVDVSIIDNDCKILSKTLLFDGH